MEQEAIVSEVAGGDKEVGRSGGKRDEGRKLGRRPEEEAPGPNIAGVAILVPKPPVGLDFSVDTRWLRGGIRLRKVLTITWRTNLRTLTPPPDVRPQWHMLIWTGSRSMHRYVP